MTEGARNAEDWGGGAGEGQGRRGGGGISYVTRSARRSAKLGVKRTSGVVGRKEEHGVADAGSVSPARVDVVLVASGEELVVVDDQARPREVQLRADRLRAFPADERPEVFGVGLQDVAVLLGNVKRVRVVRLVVLEVVATLAPTDGQLV